MKDFTLDSTVEVYIKSNSNYRLEVTVKDTVPKTLRFFAWSPLDGYWIPVGDEEPYSQLYFDTLLPYVQTPEEKKATNAN